MYKKFVILLFLLMFFLAGCDYETNQVEEVAVVQTQLRDRYIKGGLIPTGTLDFYYQTNSKITSSPAIYNDFVVFASQDGSIYKLNTMTGKMAWNTPRKLPEKIEDASVDIEDNKIFIGTKSGTM